MDTNDCRSNWYRFRCVFVPITDGICFGRPSGTCVCEALRKWKQFTIVAKSGKKGDIDSLANRKKIPYRVWATIPDSCQNKQCALRFALRLFRAFFLLSQIEIERCISSFKRTINRYLRRTHLPTHLPIQPMSFHCWCLMHHYRRNRQQQRAKWEKTNNVDHSICPDCRRK